MISIIKKILNGNIKNVFVFSTPYHLLVYLSYFGNSKLDESLLVTNAINQKVFKECFGDIINVSIDSDYKLIKSIRYLVYKLKFIPLKIALLIKKKEISFIGVDHLYFSDFLLIDEYILIEDGLANYMEDLKRSKIHSLLIRKPFGVSCKCKKVVMTGIQPTPHNIEKKVVISDLYNKEYKDVILQTFNLSEAVFQHPNILLITQPFSESGFCSEVDKITLYKNILSKKEFSDSDFLMIKPHPREATDYRIYFNNIRVLDPSIPIEVYCLAGASFDRAITVYSTGIHGIDSREKIITGTIGVDFLESKVGFINEERW